MLVYGGAIIVIGGSIIVFGIGIAQVGPVLSRRRELRIAPETGETVKLEGGVNFKGVYLLLECHDKVTRL